MPAETHHRDTLTAAIQHIQAATAQWQATVDVHASLVAAGYLKGLQKAANLLEEMRQQS